MDEPVPGDEVRLTRAQVREVERLSIEEYGIPGIVLMEHAGRAVAELVRATCLDTPARARQHDTCAVFCGGGNNGGDGFVIARFLDDCGVRVECITTTAHDATRGDALLARRSCTRAGIIQHAAATTAEFERARGHVLDVLRPRIVVDALLGTGFAGPLRTEVARAIALVNELGARSGTTTFAVDVPSGLDCDSGTCAAPTVRADVTATFVARKVGFATGEARAVLGRVHVLSIGAPRRALERAREGLTPG